VLALTMRAEIGDIARFTRGSALACYAGVVPRVESSAHRVFRGRITRDGSPWLRWALVEMARHAIKRPDAVGRWARRLAVRKGLHIARVALARVLCDQVIATWPKIS
jgi:transposase